MAKSDFPFSSTDACVLIESLTPKAFEEIALSIPPEARKDLRQRVGIRGEAYVSPRVLRFLQDHLSRCRSSAEFLIAVASRCKTKTNVDSVRQWSAHLGTRVGQLPGAPTPLGPRTSDPTLAKAKSTICEANVELEWHDVLSLAQILGDKEPGVWTVLGEVPPQLVTGVFRFGILPTGLLQVESIPLECAVKTANRTGGAPASTEHAARTTEVRPEERSQARSVEDILQCVRDARAVLEEQARLQDQMEALFERARKGDPNVDFSSIPAINDQRASLRNQESAISARLARELDIQDSGTITLTVESLAAVADSATTMRDAEAELRRASSALEASRDRFETVARNALCAESSNVLSTEKIRLVSAQGSVPPSRSTDSDHHRDERPLHQLPLPSAPEDTANGDAEEALKGVQHPSIDPPVTTSSVDVSSLSSSTVSNGVLVEPSENRGVPPTLEMMPEADQDQPDPGDVEGDQLEIQGDLSHEKVDAFAGSVDQRATGLADSGVGSDSPTAQIPASGKPEDGAVITSPGQSREKRRTSKFALAGTAASFDLPPPPRPAADLAQFVLERWGEAPPFAAVNAVAMALVVEGRTGLASWLTKSAQPSAMDRDRPPLPELIEALALGEVTTLESQSSSVAFQEALKQPALSSIADANLAASFRLLLAAAIIRPSLVIPYAPWSNLLSGLMLGPAFNALFKVVVDFSRRGIRLGPELFRNVRSEDDWDRLVRSASAKAQAARQARTMLFQRASSVWLHWQRPGELLHTLLAPITENQLSHVDDVRRQIKDLRTADVGGLVNKTDIALANRRRDPIEGKAVEQVKKRLLETIEIAEEWVQAVDSKPAAELSRDRSAASRFSQELGVALPDVRSELARIGQRGDPDAWTCAASVSAVQRLIDDLTSTLRAEPPRRCIADHRLQLGWELLCAPELPLTDDVAPNGDPATFLVPILRLVSNRTSLQKAFDARASLRDHRATEWVVEAAEAFQPSVEDGLRDRRNSLLEEARMELRTEMELTSVAIENALLSDVLTDQDRSGLVHRVQRVELSAGLDFGPALAELKQIRDAVAAKLSQRVHLCKSRLGELSPSIADRERIEMTLSRGEISIAEELIASVESNQPLPSDEVKDDLFDRFFPGEVRQMETALPNTLDAVVAEIRTGALALGGFGNTTHEQLEEVCRTLKDWWKLKGARRVEVPLLRSVLQWMGFTVRGCVVKPVRKNVDWAEISVDPLKAPVPQWGSRANGQYGVLCLWNSHSANELVELVEQQSRPTLVFYFGRLGESGRRDLAVRTAGAESRTPFVVIDDLLILSLCGHDGSRISTLLRCTLPFTSVNPYTPSLAGDVPVEMFFGRRIEATQVEDMLGPCFIFGGRQLGKSALLRFVQRRCSAIKDFQAIYLDLKAAGLGEFKPADDIWALLTDSLKSAQVLPAKMPPSAGPDVILSHVQKWLSDDTNRRILLLLDESDALLDADARHSFRIVQRLKGLMEKSGRRFKVVFAGLHNVQRFQGIPNQPLAHLGTPISIGPLEPREAARFVREPLEALGYRFESSDLVVRILSHTNYQASLVQLFCNELLAHLVNLRRDRKVAPPYPITARDVDDVYRKEQLRDRIRERFDWTLDLDPRYQVLAYTIAYECASAEALVVSGFEPHQLRVQAASWWPAGFDEARDEEIQGLLDEMVGLGLLVRAEGRRYRLRSPNVLRLLGNAEHVGAKLLQLGQLQVVPSFDLASFRRNLDSKRVIRSPLTAANETDLLQEGGRTRIVIGNPALGIDRVLSALTLSSGRTQDGDASAIAVLDRQQSSKESFASWLRESLDGKRQEHYQVVLMTQPGTLPTTPSAFRECLEEALAQLGRRTSSQRRSLLVCALGEREAAAWYSLDQPLRQALSRQTSPVNLRRWNPWFTKRWLDDLGVVPSAQYDLIIRATGGWPSLLHSLAEQLTPDQHGKTSRLEEAIQRLKPGSLVPGLGLDAIKGMRDAAMTLAEWGELTFKDFSDVCPGEVEPAIALEFLDAMGVTIQVGSNYVRVEPVIEMALKATQRAVALH